MYKTFKAGDVVVYNDNVKNPALRGTIWQVVRDTKCYLRQSNVQISLHENTIDSIKDKVFLEWIKNKSSVTRDTMAVRLDIIEDLNDYYSNCLIK